MSRASTERGRWGWPGWRHHRVGTGVDKTLVRQAMLEEDLPVGYGSY